MSVVAKLTLGRGVALMSVLLLLSVADFRRVPDDDVPISKHNIALRNIRVSRLDISVPVISPEFVAVEYGREIGKLIDKAQKTNSCWLLMWPIRNCYTLEYRRIGFHVGFSKDTGLQNQPLYWLWAGRLETVDYSGPYNRGVGFSDLAEFVVYAGLLGDPNRIGISENEYDHEPVITLSGSITGPSVSALVSRLIIRYGESNTDTLEVKKKGVFDPATYGNPSKLDYCLTFTRKDAKLVKSVYRAFTGQGSLVMGWDISYHYDVYTKLASGDYPGIARVRIEIGPAYSRLAPQLTTRNIFFTTTEGLWVATQVCGTYATKAGDNDEPGGALVIIDNLKARKTYQPPDSGWTQTIR